MGHVFKLGTFFSESLGAYYSDQEGRQKPIVMGCYGIGVGRLMAAAMEQNHDEHGIVWPHPIAPYHVHICALSLDRPGVAEAADQLYDSLQTAGLEVLYDDRDESPGVKFNDADLLGIPVRLTVSPPKPQAGRRRNHRPLHLRKTHGAPLQRRPRSPIHALHITSPPPTHPHHPHPPLSVIPSLYTVIPE